MSMHSILQFPVADLRDFVPNNFKVSSLPLAFTAPYGVFVRSFGAVRARSKGGVEDLPGEDVICPSPRAIRFASSLGNPVKGSPFSFACTFRRLSSGGKVPYRFEVGLRQRGSVPSTNWLSRSAAPSLLDAIASLHVRVAYQPQDALPVSLLRAGRAVARAYLQGTTKSQKGQLSPACPDWVGAGTPAILLEFEERDELKVPHQCQSIEVDPTKGVSLWYLRTTLDNELVGVWILLTSAAADPQYIRNLRIHLLRLHAERQCFATVLRYVLKRVVPVQVKTAHTDELLHYLSTTGGLLIRKSYSGIDQSQVSLAAYKYDALISAGETATLMAMLDSVNRDIRRVVQIALDRSSPQENLAQAAVQQTFQIQVLEGGELNMSTFDQRGQKVAYQYNAAGDINFGNVQNQASFSEELQKLRAEVAKAKESGELSDEDAVDADYHLNKAAIEAKKEGAKGSKIEEYLETAKNILGKVASLGGLVGAVTKAISLAGTLF